jgi:hypothetical protein
LGSKDDLRSPLINISEKSTKRILINSRLKNCNADQKRIVKNDLRNILKSHRDKLLV